MNSRVRSSLLIPAILLFSISNAQTSGGGGSPVTGSWTVQLLEDNSVGEGVSVVLENGVVVEHRTPTTHPSASAGISLDVPGSHPVVASFTCSRKYRATWVGFGTPPLSALMKPSGKVQYSFGAYGDIGLPEIEDFGYDPNAFILPYKLYSGAKVVGINPLNPTIEFTITGAGFASAQSAGDGSSVSAQTDFECDGRYISVATDLGQTFLPVMGANQVYEKQPRPNEWLNYRIEDSGFDPFSLSTGDIQLNGVAAGNGWDPVVSYQFSPVSLHYPLLVPYKENYSVSTIQELNNHYKNDSYSVRKLNIEGTDSHGLEKGAIELHIHPPVSRRNVESYKYLESDEPWSEWTETIPGVNSTIEISWGVGYSLTEISTFTITGSSNTEFVYEGFIKQAIKFDFGHTWGDQFQKTVLVGGKHSWSTNGQHFKARFRKKSEEVGRNVDLLIYDKHGFKNEGFARIKEDVEYTYYPEVEPLIGE